MPNPSGTLSLALTAAQTLLAGSPTFQALCAAQDAAGALAHTAIGEVGWRIQNLSVASNVLTVMLDRPARLSIGQSVTIEGPSLGRQGLKVAGYRAITALLNSVSVPWLLSSNDPLTAPDGNPWTSLTGQSEGFTCPVPSVDILQKEICDGVVMPFARPFGVLCMGDKKFEGRSIGTGGASVSSSEIDILLSAWVDPGNRRDQQAAYIQAMNTAGGIVQDLLNLQGQSDFIPLLDCSISEGPLFRNPNAATNIADEFEVWEMMLKCGTGLQ